MKRFIVKKNGANDYCVFDSKWGVKTAFFMNNSSLQELENYCRKLNAKRGE